MRDEQDRRLIAYFRTQPRKEATAAEVMAALGYASVGAVNLHVIRLAKDLAGVLSYIPTTHNNGQRRWWPCLFDGRDESHGFVWTLRKDVEDWYVSAYPDEDFLRQVAASLQDSEARTKRLACAPKRPTQKYKTIVEFDRNPDVVAEVLARSAGICQHCQAPAPFIRKSDGTPYLEVHHKTPLAFGGDDTVENSIALCPNCHRMAHYG